MNVELVLAPNPGLMTGPGTNTWVVSSRGEALVVDPGPVIETHLDAVATALSGLEVVAVVVTHTHPDHAPAANPLAQRLGVPAIGPADGADFRPDRHIADGEHVEFGGIRLVAVATPGHTADSTSYRVHDALFTGDHIMGGSTVMVEDMKDYLESLQAVHRTGLRVIYPGHGPIIDDPDRVIDEYITHRLEREAQILAAVRSGAGTVGEVVEQVYAAIDPALHAPASISVDAHLRKLAADGFVSYAGGGWSGRVVAVS
ncbi:MAG: MBL fold metallo-hydrolase [Actinomycetota bacterium]